MVLNCAICDDNRIITKEVKEKVLKIAREMRIQICVETYLNPKYLISDVQDEKVHYDFVILDIEMPEYSGMDLARIFGNEDPDCKIIFLTAYDSYAIDAYELSVFRYIPKREMDNRLKNAIAGVVELFRKNQKRVYFYKKGNHYENIPFKNIVYIVKNGKYAIFHLENEKTIHVRKPLAVVIEELDDDFIYIDKGCIVNVQHIFRVDHDAVILTGSFKRLPISGPKMQLVKTALAKFWIGD